ncbi:helix-turn-helix transcriptional regulator [Pollutimonas bauzanensis]|uniref:AraC-type DNA-binding protein n=1 Tax=Pollutimonas bauzanensis TaxID=658167 RepID=A0A1M5ZMM0_9BURK|nr:AraC family transcriptional regulator [Pollutimonas bauzanensis]SHI25615.1 AraC-type DNA-binding protein [Pollutimonas bauzanensis]
MSGSIHRRPRGVSHDPAKLMDGRLEGIPEDWQCLMQLHRPAEGCNICCMNGQPSSKWAFQAEGGPSLTLSILLEGRMEAAIDDGAEFRVDSGSVVLMATGQHTAGWDVLSAERDFRMVNINLTQQALQGLTGLQMDDLLQCMRSSSRSMAHINALMTSMPVFSTLQRAAGEISLCNYRDSKARNVFLCAKVAEVIAAVLDRCWQAHGGTAALLPVPSDRTRLMQARALLEARYGETWSVASLARSVGLSEKRLQAGFQALYGRTMLESLTHIRLDVALAMLACGTSVTETAQTVGFSSVSHFSKVFRAGIGLSPKRWAHGYQPSD